MVPRVFLFVLFWLNLTQPNRFYWGQLGDNSPKNHLMEQLRGQPKVQSGEGFRLSQQGKYSAVAAVFLVSLCF